MPKFLAILVTIALLFHPSSLQAELAAYEMDDWKYWFQQCGYAAQMVESVPEIELSTEYQHLKRRMVENASELGASPEQIGILSDSFDSGRRQAFQDGWNDEKEIPEDDKEGLEYAREGMLENRNFCLNYGK